MKNDNLDRFFCICVGIFIALIIFLFIQTYLIEPRRRKIMNAADQTQAYYRELLRTKKYAMYFVKGPMTVLFLNPGIKWDPNQLDQLEAELLENYFNPNQFKK